MEVVEGPPLTLCVKGIKLNNYSSSPVPLPGSFPHLSRPAQQQTPLVVGARIIDMLIVGF